MSGRVLMYREALREALFEEMARDDEIFIIGEGIAERGGSYKVTEGLLAEYGPARIRDTPISEASMIGVGVGAEPKAEPEAASPRSTLKASKRCSIISPACALSCRQHRRMQRAC